MMYLKTFIALKNNRINDVNHEQPSNKKTDHRNQRRELQIT